MKIFNSKYPILEACMNKGSTVPLAIAVHEAGAYPSLSSWTYGGNFNFMQKELDSFVNATNSNHIHLSFELKELIQFKQPCLQIIKSHHIPTIEIIARRYSDSDQTYEGVSDDVIRNYLYDIKQLGTKLFCRAYRIITKDEMQAHFLDGICIKGSDSAGASGNKRLPVKQKFLLQKQATPDAALIPYGGVGTSEHLKQYLELGAEIVAVGTLFAASKESIILDETKQLMIEATTRDISVVRHTVKNQTVHTQNAIRLGNYNHKDDINGTKALVSALYQNSKIGHVFAGASIDHVKEILPCKQIVQNLMSSIEEHTV